MQQLYLYILIASLTIASPGPGVLLTLTNTLNYNLRNAMAGIIGVAVGMGVISIIAASSVGVMITTSLGVKLFRSVPRALNQPLSSADSTMPSASQRFRQGVLVSLFNPKPIVFFMALFPQFIHPQQPFIPQFSVLSITFCILVVVIHSLYGLFAHSVKTKMSSGNAFVKLNKTGGIVFVCFAVGLIVSAVHPYLSS